MEKNRRVSDLAEKVGNIVDVFGQKDGRLFVNSAQSVDPDAVYAFPREAEPCGDGSISLEWIKRETRADAFGAVTIRLLIQQTATLVRETAYTKRQANKIKAGWTFLKEINGVRYSCTNSVVAAVMSHVAGVNQGRKLRGSRLAQFRNFDCSSGSVTS